MPIRSARFPFQDEFIACIAPTEGVYALWDGHAVILYGVADEENGLHGTLLIHKKAKTQACAKGASHFQVEPASNLMTVRERVDGLLREHLFANGSYPRCNLPEELLAFRRPTQLQQNW